MSLEKIEEIRDQVLVKLENMETVEDTTESEDVLEITLEELAAISGGSRVNCFQHGNLCW